MLEKYSSIHALITSASQLLSVYFQKNIDVLKVSQLSEPERRNLILRLEIANPTTDIPKTIILKKTAIEKGIFDFAGEAEMEEEQFTRFAKDWAGLEFLSHLGSKHAPHFYAGNLEHQFILIEDLGPSHASLVGPLTRPPSLTNIVDAKNALLHYIRQLGKMHADTRLRPGFSKGMQPSEGKLLFEYLVHYAQSHFSNTASGQFGAYMELSLCNDGPMTFILQSGK